MKLAQLKQLKLSGNRVVFIIICRRRHVRNFSAAAHLLVMLSKFLNSICTWSHSMKLHLPMKGWANTTNWSPPNAKASTEMDWKSRDFNREKSVEQRQMLSAFYSKSRKRKVLCNITYLSLCSQMTVPTGHWSSCLGKLQGHCRRSDPQLHLYETSSRLTTLTCSHS